MIFGLVPAVTCLAAVVQAAFGLGFPLVATPMITTIMDPRSAIVTLTLPSFFLSALQVWRGRAHLGVSRDVLPLLLAVVPGTVAGAYLLTILPVGVLTGLMGGMIILYVVLETLERAPRVPAHWLLPAGAVVGLVAGVLGAAAGMNGPLIAIYLASLGLEKNAFVVAISLAFVSGHVPKIASYAMLGLFTRERLLLSALMLPTVALGFVIGAGLRSRISQRAFALSLRVFLLVVGVLFLVRAAVSR